MRGEGERERGRCGGGLQDDRVGLPPPSIHTEGRVAMWRVSRKKWKDKTPKTRHLLRHSRTCRTMSSSFSIVYRSCICHSNSFTSLSRG